MIFLHSWGVREKYIREQHIGMAGHLCPFTLMLDRSGGKNLDFIAQHLVRNIDNDKACSGSHKQISILLEQFRRKVTFLLGGVEFGKTYAIAKERISTPASPNTNTIRKHNGFANFTAAKPFAFHAHFCIGCIDFMNLNIVFLERENKCHARFKLTIFGNMNIIEAIRTKNHTSWRNR